MPRFRKKPVIIEAMHYTGQNVAQIIAWVGSPSREISEYLTGELEIKTLEGNMKANEGDWIIRGIKGELYPCKPDIFDETYELVEEGEK